MPLPLLRRLPFSPHIRTLHAVTYLLGVSLFSISFLVFLNATLSFVLTDLLHKRSRLGDVVGTLGFVDELVAIFAAPFWGAVSDGRLGTRGVVVLCYWIVAGSLVLFVNVPTVYPGLLLARMVFSFGAAGVATMVSAILPEMTAAEDEPVSGEIVITPPPSSESSREPVVSEAGTPPAQFSGKLAGLVGLFTGCGALLALLVFLRLPTRFAQYGPEEAVRRAFYTVAATAAVVGIWCFFGLPGRGKGAGHWSFRRYMYSVRVWIWTKIWGGSPEALPSLLSPPSSPSTSPPDSPRAPSSTIYAGGLRSLKTAFKAGLTDSRLSLSYLAGFVARATSVGISLFVPLFVNAYFIRQGLCPPSTPSSPTPQTCRQAYTLAAKLTGTTQLTALLLAPAFGFWTDHAAGGVQNTPLVVSALLGVVGFTGFGTLISPEPRENPMVWVYAIFMGAAQIGGIVCSLALLARAVSSRPDGEEEERQPLLSGVGTSRSRDRRHAKGGIAGVYSLSGGIGILALTKLGGWGFDGIGNGWPFWLLAGFEGVLVLAGVLEGIFGSGVGGQR